MDLYIYNPQIEGLGVVDTFSSFRWRRKFFEPGEFELHCAATTENIAMLKEDNIIHRKGRKEAGKIEGVVISNTDNGDEISATGRFLSSKLADRIITPTINFSGTVENAMRKIVSDNAITARPIDLLSLGALNDFTPTTSFQATGKNVLAMLTALTKSSDIGYMVRLDVPSKTLWFETYQGTDRTVTQTARPYVLFSDSFNNITTGREGSAAACGVHIMMRCIDVSAHQGRIDWPAVAASGIQAVIIRAGYGNSVSQQDKQFAANIKGAAAAGLKIGIYWFSYADSVADALKEWAVCKSIIEPYRDKITLPVVYDYEYDSVNYYKKIHGAAPSNTLINQMVNAFLGAAKADGWGTALYTNNDYRLHVFTAATLAMWDIWLADYTGGSDIPCAIQQTSSTGKVPGISGNVDLNTIFKDYLAERTTVQIDTTMDISFAHGMYYTVKTACPRQVEVTAGTPGIVTIVPLPRTGTEQLFVLVAVGESGKETGIYTAAPGEKPLRRFKYKIK